VTLLNAQPIQKLVPFHRIYSSAPGDGDITAFLRDRMYRSVAGASAIEGLRRAKYEGLVEITEVPTPVGPEAQKAFNQLQLIYPTVHEALSSYQPILIEGFAQHRRWTQAEVRLNTITRALGDVSFPFDDLSVLDMGCVIGFMSLAFDSFGCNVTGIDIDTPAVSIAKAYNDIVLGSVDFQVASALEFISDCKRAYDVILCINLLHWLWKRREDESQIISFIRRLADLTNIALFIATPFDATSGLADLKPKDEPSIDALRRWCGDKFSSVQFLASGPRHPMYMCVK